MNKRFLSSNSSPKRSLRMMLLNWMPLLFLAGPVMAQYNISFDTSIWDHSAAGGSTNTGWNPDYHVGTTEFTPGVTLTVTFTPRGSAEGTAEAFETNYTHATTNIGPGLANVNTKSTDNNGDYYDLYNNSGTTTLANYNLTTFSFSAPVTIANFGFFDIDDDNGTWVDGLGIEGFTSESVGALGTGFSPTVSYNQDTHLFNDSSVYGVEYITVQEDELNPNLNPQGTPEHDAYISFATAVQSFSLYLSDPTLADAETGSHGIAFEDVIYVVVVPEISSVALLGIGGVTGLGLLLFRRRRR